MTLLEDIQNSAVDSKSDLASLLRKCKLLAARLGSQPLEDWVLWESNGYPDDIGVPDYRIWVLEIKGYFVGPMGATLQNYPIPLACLPEKARRVYERYECRQSIAGIEVILVKAGSCTTLHVDTGDLALLLGTNVYQHYNCIQVSAECNPSALVEVVNTVRNRILDFTLAVWKEAPTAGDTDGNPTPKIETSRVTQIFNTTVFGGAANLVGTASQSVIEFNIGVKDVAALERILRDNGVAESEIVELRDAIETEPEMKPNQGFGPRVSSWIGKMLGKAADGSWKIGTGAAGSLLAQVIAKYYGL
jgi:hypothetical protein